MKRITNILAMSILILLSLNATAQQNQKTDSTTLTILPGLRLNPFLSWRFGGGDTLDITKTQANLGIYAEAGVLIDDKAYIALGFNPLRTSIYSFNEYFVVPTSQKNPVGVIGVFVYDFINNVPTGGVGVDFGFNGGKIWSQIYLYTSDFQSFIMTCGIVVPLNFKIKSIKVAKKTNKF